MPVQTYVDAFTVTTAAVNTTFVRTGYGFQPVAALVWCSGRTEATDAVGAGHARWCIGFVTSPTSRACFTAQSQDGAATTDTDGSNSTTAVLFTIVSASATEGLLDVSAIGADGMTFIIDDQFTTELRVHVWAIGGSDVTHAAIVTTNTPTVTGAVDYVVPGSFQPDIVFALCRGGGASARHGFGYALSAANQGMIGMKARDNVVTSDTARFGRSGSCVAVNSATNTSITLEASLVQMNSDGYRLNWTIADGSARALAVLAIKGGNWTGGESVTRTDTTPFALTTTGITPKGLLVASHGTAECTTVYVAHGVLSVGAASSPSNRGAHGYSDENALPDAEVATILEHDAVYARLDLADGIAGLMDVQAMSPGQIDLVMDDPDPDAAWFWWVACGEPVAVAGGPRVNSLALCGAGR